MNNLVRYSKCCAVGIITVLNPPVNALTGMPRGVIDGIAAGGNDPDIRAPALIGSGRTFIAGADIREFDKPRPPGDADLWGIIARLEGASIPTIAAIHGSALG